MGSQPAHPLTLIPGPIEFDDAVLAESGHFSVSHTAAPFVEAFSEVLKGLRVLFQTHAPDVQPFVIAGGGTLGWDIAGANFLEQGDKVLCLNTGFFAANWAKCLQCYGADVTELKSEVGGATSESELETALSANKFNALTITHVDTSTGVLQDLKAISAVVKRVSPETLIFVDGVCSVGIEELRFDEWGLDFALTGPQKGIGAPAGVSISMASKRAMDVVANRKTPCPVYYHDLKRWVPIMQAYESGKPAYFSTPAVQCVFALREALRQIGSTEEAVQERWAAHKAKSDEFKDFVEKLGLKLLALNRKCAAHGLSAIYLPEGVELPKLLSSLLNKNFVVAGGILPPIATKYFRVGHMGVSILKYDHVDSLMKQLPDALKSVGN